MNIGRNDGGLDRLLGASEEIAPSSGFVSSVMEAVQREAAAPQPIPFPWKWSLPGFVVSVGLVVYALIRLAASSAPAAFGFAARFPLERQLPIVAREWVKAPVGMGIEWSAVGLLVSLFSVWLSMRIGRE